jgi:hypothetical protein
MMHLRIAAIPSLVVGSVVIGLVAACSGSAGNSIPGPSSSSGSTGNASGGSSGSSGTSGSSGSSGCAPCDPPAPAGCRGTGACGCGPYVCPDAGLGEGDDCKWAAADPCGPGLYCESANCGTGKCARVATDEDGTRKPVCGCDKVTYWNAKVAAKHGMSVGSDTACGNPVDCGGLMAKSCSSSAFCNYRMQADQCSMTEPTGTCWVLPAACAATPSLERFKRCTPKTCGDECTLIREQLPYFSSGAGLCVDG